MYVSGDERAGEAGALLSGARLRDESRDGAASALAHPLAKPTPLIAVRDPARLRVLLRVRGRVHDRGRHGGKGLLRLYRPSTTK